MTTLSAVPAAPRSRSRLADRVAQQLSEQIRQGRFRLGTQLPGELRLAELFEVSRSVIREVICNLQARGLVATRQGAGSFVINRPTAHTTAAAPTACTLESVLQALEIRSAFEVEAAGLAALRGTELQVQVLRHTLDRLHASGPAAAPPQCDGRDFHLQVARCAGNRYLLDAVASLCSVCIPTATTQPGTALERRKVAAEHEQIYAAIRRRDPQSAQAAMLVHLANERERTLQRYDRATQGQAGRPLPAVIATSPPS